MQKVLTTLSSALVTQNSQPDVTNEEAEYSKELNNSVDFVKNSLTTLEQILENNLNLITKMKEENKDNK